MMPDPSDPSVGVFYLAWGMLEDPLAPFDRFIASYKRYGAGCKHELNVICKGFARHEKLDALTRRLAGVSHNILFVEEQQMDIGAYYIAALNSHANICLFLNTYSEILSENWLAKYMSVLSTPGVGLVGSSGSYESASHNRHDNVPFPNPHLRTNAFMLRKDLFFKIKPRSAFVDKLSTYLFEHQRASLTRSVVASGLTVKVVGKNGRGYDVAEWPTSGTFRQADQSNLLIADNRTRQFAMAPPEERKVLHRMAWGDRSLGPVRVLAVEEQKDTDFVAAAYEWVCRRSPTPDEARNAIERLSHDDAGKAKFLEVLSLSSLTSTS